MLLHGVTRHLVYTNYLVIFVVIGIGKSHLRKTEYKLINIANPKDILWVKLRRSELKKGVDFHPLRKVLYLGKYMNYPTIAAKVNQ